jgi:hypothetical protein
MLLSIFVAVSTCSGGGALQRGLLLERRQAAI